MSTVILQADVLTPLLNSVTPGMVVMIAFTIAITAAYFILLQMRKDISGIRVEITAIKMDAITEQFLHLTLLKVGADNMERYDKRYVMSRRQEDKGHKE